LSYTAIVGIDCSTNIRKLGIARGEFADGKLTVTEVLSGRKNQVETVASWVRNSPRTLMAFDAPLGWPEAMGPNLASHQAGAFMDVDSNTLFRRYTDSFIKQKLNKQPLDVGANLIARTGLFALKFIEALRKQTGHSIPLAWTSQFTDPCAAIEVYPAATLESRGISSSGYKSAEQLPRRREILGLLGDQIQLKCDAESVVSSDDNLDAVLCLLAAADFLADNAYPPPEDMKDTVEKESWIWAKHRWGQSQVPD
jgi:hypothetical protein